MSERDHLITIDKPKKPPERMSQTVFDAYPSSLTVREFKVSGKIPVTTLTCPKTSLENELKGLYKRRWHMELDWRDIKDTLGMNIRSCKTPERVIKEIWVYLLAYNRVRLTMVRSALKEYRKRSEYDDSRVAVGPDVLSESAR